MQRVGKVREKISAEDAGFIRAFCQSEGHTASLDAFLAKEDLPAPVSRALAEVREAGVAVLEAPATEETVGNITTCIRCLCVEYQKFRVWEWDQTYTKSDRPTVAQGLRPDRVLERCNCGPEHDRRCLGCGRLFCSECHPDTHEVRCLRCNGPVYVNNETLPPARRNPFMRGY